MWPAVYGPQRHETPLAECQVCINYEQYDRLLLNKMLLKIRLDLTDCGVNILPQMVRNDTKIFWSVWKWWNYSYTDLLAPKEVKDWRCLPFLINGWTNEPFVAWSAFLNYWSLETADQTPDRAIAPNVNNCACKDRTIRLQWMFYHSPWAFHTSSCTAGWYDQPTGLALPMHVGVVCHCTRVGSAKQWYNCCW